MVCSAIKTSSPLGQLQYDVEPSPPAEYITCKPRAPCEWYAGADELLRASWTVRES